MAFSVGDAVPLTYTISAAATVVLTVTDPDGTISNPSPTQSGSPPAVTYSATIAATKAGNWLARFVATGAVTDAEDQQFFVQPAATATLYTTVAEVREHLADTNSQLPAGQVEAKIRAASRWVDQQCDRKFWLDPAATTRHYQPTSPYELWVDDIGSTTGLIVKTDTAGAGTYATTWTITTDFKLEPLDADQHGGAYAWWRIRAVGSKTFPLPASPTHPSVQVTARHGWSQIPDEIREATLLRAVALWRRKDAPFGIAGISDFGPLRITRTDPDVTDLLRPYMWLTGIA